MTAVRHAGTTYFICPYGKALIDFCCSRYSNRPLRRPPHATELLFLWFLFIYIFVIKLVGSAIYRRLSHGTARANSVNSRQTEREKKNNGTVSFGGLVFPIAK